MDGLSGEKWHGTIAGYTRHYCRCDACKAVMSAYGREYRSKDENRERRRLQIQRWRAARRAQG